MELVDTHCHLFAPPMGADPLAVLARSRSAGVVEVWVPGVDLKSSTRALELSAGLPGVRVAVGLHPQAVGADAGRLEEELAGLRALAARGGAVAVGEIGLDGEMGGPMELQERAFRAQLELAHLLRLPALVHCRGAFARLQAILEESEPAAPRVVLHAWAGSPEITEQLARRGCFFGVAGVVTRPAATRARARLRSLPPERMLLETDAPYIGTARCPKGAVEPAAVAEVCEAVAALSDRTPEEVAACSTANARKLRGGGEP